MEKFSVKKPFTVLVAVVMVLILGFVAITKMQTNLLPDVSTPYLMVVTVYPGASPERVESEVSDVLQNALTVPGVENITATSAENYSLLLMHFTDDTDMNSALVKVSNKLDQAKSDLPSSCLTPSIIEYSLNMNAFMTVAVSREGSDIYQMSELVKDTLVPYVQRKGGVSNVSSSGLVEKLVQVQLNQDKIDEINAQLLDLIDTKLADARAQLDSAESQIAAGRAEYDRQMKNFGNTVSNTVLASMSTEVGNAVDVVRKQAQALMESVNQLIAVVKEPEIQQALIEVQQGLQKVLDKFDNTGMRDIDSLIEVVSELRDVTDKLTDALQKLQERVNTETGTEGSSAADLADELQLQQSLQVIYSTLEDTIKAMDNVPQLMSTFSGALGSFTQQQLNAYMQFTEAREQLNEYEKQLEEAKQELESKYGIKVLPVQADVCAGGDNEATVQNVVKQAVDAFGGIQVLINNAQASASGVSLAEHTTEQFDLALYSGLYAAFYYMKACYPYLKESHGSVINFASGAGLFGNYGQCAYAAAKEGIRGLSRVAATEWGPDDINVNVVCPLAWTAKLEQFQQAYPEAFKANVKMPPMGHYGNAELEIGRVCVQLAMPDFKFMSGETLTLEGGMGQRP